MKLYFNKRPVAGPWGGGSKVLSAIIEGCANSNHEVFFEEQLFSGEKFDLLFCFDPRPSGHVTHKDLISYKQKNDCRILQRVGDLGTHGKPELLQLAKELAQHSDVLIFPSNWAMQKFCMYPEKSFVIPNAPLQRFYEANREKKEDGKVRILTHHWSDNPKKGFKTYQKLDQYCKKNDRFVFTYVGRTPPNVSFDNHIQPLDVEGLLQEMPKHDFYFTASEEEAGANHVLEAMAVGLPVFYSDNGGSIVEYCRGQGFSFQTFSDFKTLIETKFDAISKLQVSYSRTTNQMVDEYLQIIEAR